MPIVRLRVRGVDRDRASRDGDVEADDARATPSVEALGDEISLEQCERLFVCLRFRACRAMCETVYRAYAMNPNAPRPLRARTTPSLEETGETEEEEDEERRKRRRRTRWKRQGGGETRETTGTVSRGISRVGVGFGRK